MKTRKQRTYSMNLMLDQESPFKDDVRILRWFLYGFQCDFRHFFHIFSGFFCGCFPEKPFSGYFGSNSMDACPGLGRVCVWSEWMEIVREPKSWPPPANGNGKSLLFLFCYWCQSSEIKIQNPTKGKKGKVKPKALFWTLYYWSTGLAPWTELDWPARGREA